MFVLFLAWVGCADPKGPDADGDGTPDAEDCAPRNASVSPEHPEACNGLDDDCNGSIDDGLGAEGYADADGDGYGVGERVTDCAGLAAPVSGDCNDAAALDHPGAPEVCDGRDNDCDGVVDEDPVNGVSGWADQDGDGYGATAASGCEGAAGWVDNDDDCDDTDPARSPDAPELCNGQDDDCDGLADDADADLVPLDGYADQDGDGWGSDADPCGRPRVETTGDCDDDDPAAYPGAPTACAAGADLNCDLRDDAVDVDADGAPDCTDCDDANPAISPAAPEVCNSLDDNCDGVTDGADAVDIETFYADDDHDRFGDPTRATQSCDLPRGYTDNTADCDDTNEHINPDATESCRSVEDENCDGSLDAVNALGCVQYYADVDGDGYGDLSDSICTCEPDASHPFRTGGDCDDADATVHPASEDVCGDGVDADCDTLDHCPVAGLPVVVAGVRLDEAIGGSMAAGDDVTGDGVADLVVGTPEYEGTSGQGGGLVYAGPIKVGMGDPAFAVEVDGGDEGLGYIVSTGDLNGDGQADVVLAWGHATMSGTFSGVVRGYFGPVSGPVGSSAADVTLTGAAYDQIGQGVGWGDPDGDGVANLFELNEATTYGEINGYPSLAAGTYTPDDAAWTLRSDATLKSLGEGLGVGDLDGDGADDLIYGLTQYGDGGAVGWYQGPLPDVGAVADQAGMWTAPSGEAFWGDGVQILEDVDGDGLRDIGVDGYYAHAYLGAVPTGVVSGDTARAFFDVSVSYEPEAMVSQDMDGDGRRELVVGAPDLVEAGAVSVYAMPFSGRLSPLDAWFGVTGEGVGTSALASGDVDGDGLLDVLLGALELGPDGVGGGGVVLLTNEVSP